MDIVVHLKLIIDKYNHYYVTLVFLNNNNTSTIFCTCQQQTWKDEKMKRAFS